MSEPMQEVPIDTLLKRAHRVWLERWLPEGPLAAARTLFADDLAFDFHGGFPIERVGRDGVLELVVTLRRAFRELRVAVTEQLVAGDTVVNTVVLSGRHTGTIRGLEPAHQVVSTSGVVIARARDRRIDRLSFYVDSLRALQSAPLSAYKLAHATVSRELPALAFDE